MKIAFKTPILNIDGRKMHENLTNDDGSVKMMPKPIEGVDTLQGAHMLGFRDAFMDGNVVKRAHIEVREVLLEHVCTGALTKPWPGEELTSDEKFERWRLAARIRAACDDPERIGVLDIDVQDVAKILRATDKWSEGANAVIPYFARARELLNG